MKITKEVEEACDSKGRMTVLEYDEKSKSERETCKEQFKMERKGVRVNVGLSVRNILHERRASEIIKTIDDARNLEEYMQKNTNKNVHTST